MNKKNKTTVFPLVSTSSEEKNALDKTESSSLPTISDLESQLPSTEETSIFTTAINTPENFSKS